VINVSERVRTLDQQQDNRETPKPGFRLKLDWDKALPLCDQESH